MKLILSCIFVVLTLNAGMFENYPKENSIHIKNNFIENVSDANAVIKKGNYERYAKYSKGINSTIKHIDKLDITKGEKVELRNDLQKYSNIINDIYKQLHTNAPELNEHYKKSVAGLKKFNSKLSSIGYRPLLSLWYDLSKTKARFVRKPNKRLLKKFNENYKLMIISITELYLDDEVEQPLFKYLENYKIHFDEISMTYQSIGYENINILKPLSYKIKAKMEFLSPIKL